MLEQYAPIPGIDWLLAAVMFVLVWVPIGYIVERRKNHHRVWRQDAQYLTKKANQRRN